MESGVEAKGLTRYASGHLSQRLLPGRAWASLHAELIELSTVFLPCPCGPVGAGQMASGQRRWSQRSSSEKGSLSDALARPRDGRRWYLLRNNASRRQGTRLIFGFEPVWTCDDVGDRGNEDQAQQADDEQHHAPSLI
jgi:hypothetical protein